MQNIRDVRNNRKLIGMILAVVLLSFFCTVQERLPGNLQSTEAAACRPAADGTHVSENGENAAAQGGTKLVSALRGMDDVAVWEQKTVRVLAVRFLPAAELLLSVIWIVCCIAIWRFGFRQIVLWRNITYIHRTDGEKGNVLLYR